MLRARAASLPILPSTTGSAPAPVSPAPILTAPANGEPWTPHGGEIVLIIVLIVIFIAIVLGTFYVCRQCRRKHRPQAPKTSYQRWIQDSFNNLENGTNETTYRGVSHARQPSGNSLRDEGYFGSAGDSAYMLDIFRHSAHLPPTSASASIEELTRDYYLRERASSADARAVQSRSTGTPARSNALPTNEIAAESRSTDQHDRNNPSLTTTGTIASSNTQLPRIESTSGTGYRVTRRRLKMLPPPALPLTTTDGAVDPEILEEISPCSSCSHGHESKILNGPWVVPAKRRFPLD